MILSRIDYSARRMQGLLEDLMNFANLVRGGEQLSVVDADKLLQSVVEYLKQEIAWTKGADEAPRNGVHMRTTPLIGGSQ